MPATIGNVNTTPQTRERTLVNESSKLGKDEFMQILITQLKYQDPLSPMQDTEFISQMAQFSSLEQMSQMNSVTVMNSAYNMIGKLVSFKGEDGEELAGAVESVFKGEDGMPRLQVGEYVLNTEDVISVYDKSAINGDTLEEILEAIKELNKAVEALKPANAGESDAADDDAAQTPEPPPPADATGGSASI